MLIYSKTEKEHVKHVKKICAKLVKAGLYGNEGKCVFGTRETEFLGYIISPKGVSLDPERIKAIQEWREPTTITEIKSFTGFCGVYKRFIKGFSKITAPLS